MNNYNKKFAPYYDKYWNHFSVAVFKKFKKDLRNKDVCDIACGTGNFIKKAKKITKSIEGVDASRDFINYAKKNNPKVRFETTNIENWHKENKYNLVVCFYDSVNHFNNWSKAFKNIFKSLKNNGKFIFDINTIKGFKKWDGEYTYKTNKGKIIMNGNTISRRSAKMNITITDSENQILSKLEVFEKTYSIKEVKKMLKLAGFKKIKNLGNVLRPENKNRIFFECTK